MVVISAFKIDIALAGLMTPRSFEPWRSEIARSPEKYRKFPQNTQNTQRKMKK
jgi:hypothetical protein